MIVAEAVALTNSALVNMVTAAQASPDSGLLSWRAPQRTTPNYGEKRIQRNTSRIKSAIFMMCIFLATQKRFKKHHIK